jgi:MoxR-like ATPase
MGAQIGRRIIGQAQSIEHILVTLFAGGHALFVGVPGLAKTLLVQTVADAMGLTFRRIQFTPDLMPSDITGTRIIEEENGKRSFRFRPGPVFANLVLADEINRTPPKTQAALLESMQEGAVTSDGERYRLGPPFHVFATQNPLEQEGTYPLPEAQLDRFMMMVRVDYPTFDEELQVVRQTPGAADVHIEPQMTLDELLAFQRLVRRVPLAEAQLAQAVRWVRATRPQSPEAPAGVRQALSFGAGPRAAQALVMAARARALIMGRYAVDHSDLTALVHPVLRHRLLLNYTAEAEGQNVEAIIDAVLAHC